MRAHGVYFTQYLAGHVLVAQLISPLTIGARPIKQRKRLASGRLPASKLFRSCHDKDKKLVLLTYPNTE